jgi:hypothetical protein
MLCSRFKVITTQSFNIDDCDPTVLGHSVLHKLTARCVPPLCSRHAPRTKALGDTHRALCSLYTHRSIQGTHRKPRPWAAHIVKPCSFILTAFLSPRPWVAHMVISQYQGRHTQKRTSHCVSVWLVRQNATFLGLHTRESRSVAHAPVALANAPKLLALNKRVRGQHHKTVLARRSLIKTQMALEN